MANIDLTNIFKKKVDTVSPVDSEIIIDKSQSKEEIYSDIKMEIVKVITLTRTFLKMI